MKNREILNKMNMYDLLCRLNEGLSDVNDEVCILDALNGCATTSSYCYDYSCERCIADWMNEESTISAYKRRD